MPLPVASALASFFLNPRKPLIAIAAVGAIGLGYLAYDWVTDTIEIRIENERLQRDLESMQRANEIAEFLRLERDNALAALAAAEAQLDDSQADARVLRDRIISSGDSANGELAPVSRDALRAIGEFRSRGMRDEASSTD